MAIQQHPLPQDISSYRFRLIGDMTIKQFASLGIGIVVAIIFYSSPLPFFFKYPLSFLFLLLGVGMAFVPIQGRTLDVWIFAFIRSIYSPTQYVWKQTSPENITSDTAAPTSRANIQVAPVVSNAKMEISSGITAPVITITPPTADINTQTENAQVPTAPIDQTSTPNPTVSSPAIPNPVTITPESTPSVVQVAPLTSTPPIPIVSAPQPSPTSEISNQIQTNNPQLPIPFTPSSPNTLVGLTITTDNRILDGVLVEIQKNGLTSRATKSNKLGQFMFARPLENGLYQIFAEKDGFTFSPYSLELTGEIIRPLKIQANPKP